MRLEKFLFLSILLLSLAGCSTGKKDNENIISANVLYSQGKELLESRKYSKAAEEFEKIYFQHPGASITPQAELMEAYSLYLGTQYEDCVDVLDNFIKIHPMNLDISYAYYLKGLAEYMQISRSELDQSITEKAKVAFDELITRFPDTKYAIDASLKMDLINDHLAASEMDVGRFYLITNNPISAIGRFQKVIQNYGTTSHVAEALYRMTESYLILGIKEEATKYASVLGYNYNSNKWYKKAYILLSHSK